MTSNASYRLTSQQTVTVLRSSTETDGRLLEVESVWSHGGDLPPTHFHPAQSEHFEVLEGELRVSIDGSERLLTRGDVLDIPRGAVHAMAATSDGTRAKWQIRPALRTKQFFAAMDSSQRRGGLLLDTISVVRSHKEEIRLASPPPIVQGPLFAVLALVARLLRR
jgi:quercetin dioxygenase-like cupin family protein